VAADGSKGPKPYTQRQARTIFVRVPAPDWPLVRRGLKREFRGSIGRQSALFATPTPTPAVFYSLIRGTYECRLMILEDVRQEMLGEISPESLAAEGFPDLASFRRYWMDRERNGKKFPPTKKVFVYKVRPLEPSDREEMGVLLFDRLYGEFA
jgi:hypothetical protein